MPEPVDVSHSLAYARLHKVSPDVWEITARITELADGTIAEHDDEDAPLAFSTHASDRGILRIALADWATPLAPPLWFVLVDEKRSTPHAVNLVAFADNSIPAGTVISHYQFATLGIRNETQAGAVRWYPDGGLVHQIFVAQQWRRHQVATHLLYAAEALHQSHAWPGRLNGDGRRTDLGEQLIAGLAAYPSRFLPLAETMPPMDPS